MGICSHPNSCIVWRFIHLIMSQNSIWQTKQDGKKPDFEHILVTHHGGLTTITLNRPTKYNAFNNKVNNCNSRKNKSFWMP